MPPAVRCRGGSSAGSRAEQRDRASVAHTHDEQCNAVLRAVRASTITIRGAFRDTMHDSHAPRLDRDRSKQSHAIANRTVRFPDPRGLARWPSSHPFSARRVPRWFPFRSPESARWKVLLHSDSAPESALAAPARPLRRVHRGELGRRVTCEVGTRWSGSPAVRLQRIPDGSRQVPSGAPLLHSSTNLLAS